MVIALHNCAKLPTNRLIWYLLTHLITYNYQVICRALIKRTLMR